MTSPTHRPLIAAHRGASKAQPENTIAAFLAAVSMGADMVELDVRLSADGQLVVHHDPWVRRETDTQADGRVAICDLTRAELPAAIPSLIDSLVACRPLQVNIEIKSDRNEPGYDPAHRLTDQVLELLEDATLSSGVLISSFDRDVIDRVKTRADWLATGFLYSFAMRPSRIIQSCAEAGHGALHPNHAFVTEKFIVEAHEAGLVVNVWTVDGMEKAQRLAKWGVDTIITNVPDQLIAGLS